MPEWFVDFGRWAGGVVVFALCAAFSVLALIPCWFAYRAIEGATSTMWAVASMPFLYGLWGWSYCLLCVVYKQLIFYRPREGEYPLFSFPTVGWGTTGALTNWIAANSTPNTPTQCTARTMSLPTNCFSRCGNTGMMSPNARMSIRTVMKMKASAALRAPGAAVSVTESSGAGRRAV
jgi:hypothetical protein